MKDITVLIYNYVSTSSTCLLIQQLKERALQLKLQFPERKGTSAETTIPFAISLVFIIICHVPFLFSRNETYYCFKL